MKKVYGQDLRQILLDLKHEVPEAVDKFPLPRLLDILIRFPNDCLCPRNRRGSPRLKTS